jgi:hypothetical protein
VFSIFWKFISTCVIKRIMHVPIATPDVSSLRT